MPPASGLNILYCCCVPLVVSVRLANSGHFEKKKMNCIVDFSKTFHILNMHIFVLFCT